MTLEHDVRFLKDRIEASKGKRAGHEHQQRVAETARDQSLAQLKEEFGVDRIEDADELLRQLEQAAAAECRTVEAQLAVAEEGL